MGAKPPSYLIVSCQNWKVLASWRYDFWDIVSTITELAKTEQETSEVFKNSPYVLRGGLNPRNDKSGETEMTEQYRDVRKEINLTAEEMERIEKLMNQANYRHFSPFVRDKLLAFDEEKLTIKACLCGNLKG